MYEGKDRYQFQPWYVKAYRRVRFFPNRIRYLLEILLPWLLTGAKVDGEFWSDRREVFWHIWQIAQSCYEMDVCNYWSHEEIMEKLGNGKRPFEA